MDFKWWDDRMGVKINPPPTLLIYFSPPWTFTLFLIPEKLPTLIKPPRKILWWIILISSNLEYRPPGTSDKDSPFIPGTRSATDIEMLMLKDLRKLGPFRLTPNRCHEHFQEINLSPLVGQDMEKFFPGLKSTRSRLQWDKKHGHQSTLAFMWKSQLNSNAVIFFQEAIILLLWAPRIMRLITLETVSGGVSELFWGVPANFVTWACKCCTCKSVLI